MLFFSASLCVLGGFPDRSKNNKKSHISDNSTKAREVDGLRRVMGYFGLDRGLVVTLNHSEIMYVDEGMIEFLPYRIWALQRMKEIVGKA